MYRDHFSFNVFLAGVSSGGPFSESYAKLRICGLGLRMSIQGSEQLLNAQNGYSELGACSKFQKCFLLIQPHYLVARRDVREDQTVAQ